MKRPDCRRHPFHSTGKWFFSLLLVFWGCDPAADSVATAHAGKDRESEVVYAEKFSLGWDSGCRVVKVFSPEHAVMRTYVLVDGDVILPVHLQGATVVRVPVESVTCESGFQVSLLDMLGCFETIRGVSGKRRVGQEKVHRMLDRGEMTATGFMRTVNMEAFLEADPDIAFLNVSGASPDIVEKMEAYGLRPGYFCATVEEHPLGALEWIKFMGAFFQKDSLAAELFRQKEKAYLDIQRKAVTAGFRPSVIAGYSRKGAWSTMGSSRWFVAMLDHAGATYLFQGSGLERGHLLGPEEAVEAGLRADYWVNTHYTAGNLEELLAMDQRYSLFRSVGRETVYNNNNFRFASGRNRFWDQGMTEPDVILADLVGIFHPEILSGREPVYYRRLVDAAPAKGRNGRKQQAGL